MLSWPDAIKLAAQGVAVRRAGWEPGKVLRFGQGRRPEDTQGNSTMAGICRDDDILADDWEQAEDTEADSGATPR